MTSLTLYSIKGEELATAKTVANTPPDKRGFKYIRLSGSRVIG